MAVNNEYELDLETVLKDNQKLLKFKEYLTNKNFEEALKIMTFFEALNEINGTQTVEQVEALVKLAEQCTNWDKQTRNELRNINQANNLDFFNHKVMYDMQMYYQEYQLSFKQTPVEKKEKKNKLCIFL